MEIANYKRAMTKKTHHIIFIIFFTILCAVSPKVKDVQAEEASGIVSGMEALLLERINHARSKPFETAAQYGVSPEALLVALPNPADILNGGLPLLRDNALLRTSAIGHTLDMLENDYYNMVSLDNRTPQERIAATGYLPEISGEILGVVAFKNFMPQETAMDILFENMFMKEVTADASVRRNLLNPDFAEIGIGIATGTMTIGNARYNVYLATCDFGAQLLETAQTKKMIGQLIQLINQARAWPLDVAATMDYDVETMLNSMPESESYLFTGLPPMAVNSQLSAAARAHTVDMLTSGYFAGVSPEGQTAEDRIAATGYDAYFAGEVIFQYAAPVEAAPDDLVSAIFDMIFRTGLDVPDTAGRIILNRKFEDIGVGLACRTAWVDEQEAMLCTGTLTAGLKLQWENPKIAGLVFVDRNNDGFYNPGEELSGAQLTISGGGVLQTGSAGQFQLPTAPGIYQISMVTADQDTLFRMVDLDYENKGIYFRLDATTGGKN